MKNKTIYWIVLLIFGIILLVIGNMDLVNPIMGSFGAGLCGASIAQLIRNYRISKNEEYKKRIEIAQKDERNVSIAHKAGFEAMRLMMWVLCLSEIMLFAIGLNDIGHIVGFIICLNLILYCCLFYFYKKKGE